MVTTYKQPMSVPVPKQFADKPANTQTVKTRGTGAAITGNKHSKNSQ